MRGQQLVSGKVVDYSDSIFTPCEYLIECDSFPNLRKLVSYRGRFTEQISKDMSFEALGRLEMVIDHRNNNQYMQLVMGERPTDYLIPKE
jgi:predicted nucleotidyltransferase